MHNVVQKLEGHKDLIARSTIPEHLQSNIDVFKCPLYGPLTILSPTLDRNVTRCNDPSNFRLTFVSTD